MKPALVLVGAHLLLGGSLLVIQAVHGIDDQDASFAVALLFHHLNFPSVWLLRAMGVSPGVGAVIAAGVVQWGAVGAVIAGLCRMARGLAGRRGTPAGLGA